MKIKSLLTLSIMLLISISCSAQFFRQKIAKSTFQSDLGKTVVFKSGQITITTSKGIVSAMLNGKKHVLANPPKDEQVEVTAYDLNGDKKPEIFVAYFDVTDITSKVLVFDGSTLKKIGVVPTGDFFEFKKGAVIGRIGHNDITEKHIYYLKKGKFVMDEVNSIY